MIYDSYRAASPCGHNNAILRYTDNPEQNLISIVISQYIYIYNSLLEILMALQRSYSTWLICHVLSALINKIVYKQV